jgi:phosphoribosylformylglycinamidine synthase
MLVVVDKGKEKIVEDIFDKWDLNCEIIGEVIGEDKLYFYMHDELVAEVSASTLVLGGGAPVYEREYKEPAYYKEFKKFKIDDVKEPEDYIETAKQLLQSPNIASKKWVIEQYDSMVGTGNMTTNFPSDAGIYNIKDTNRALAMTVDCNSRYVKADPEKGTEIAVSEAARNIVCSGGVPLAITNCLNFGNPYNPEAYWQFVGAIKGMGHACKKFNTPVTGGNVSFYNQMQVDGRTEPINPTPTIGMIGLIEDKNDQMSIAFKNKGDMIYLIGKSRDDINSSEYLNYIHNIEESPVPHFNLEEEHDLQEAIKGLIKKNFILSAHDVADGGLFVTLVESAMVKCFGFDITPDAEIRKDAFLFGESQSRVVVSVSPSNEDHFIDYMIEKKIPFSALGHVTKSELRIDDNSYGFINDIRKLYDNALENYLKEN